MPKPRSSQVSLIDTPTTIAYHAAIDVPFYVRKGGKLLASQYA